MIEIISKDQLATLHIGDKFIYRGSEYVAQSEPYEKNGQIGVDVDTENSLWRAAYKYELGFKLANLGRNIAIQGELVGNGIQGNIYKMRDQDFLVYDIYDIDAGRYFTPAERKALVAELKLNHCPVLNSTAELGDDTIEELLKMADGQSVMGLIGCKREGLVWKCNERQVSFKAISNAYLLG